MWSEAHHHREVHEERVTAADMLEAWRDATRAAELADRLAKMAAETADRAEVTASGADEVAKLAERAAEAAEAAARRARESAEQARAIAQESRDRGLPDAEAQHAGMRDLETKAREAYFAVETDSQGREREST
jgi:methyl-accepting chemotaxis protein